MPITLTRRCWNMDGFRHRAFLLLPVLLLCTAPARSFIVVEPPPNRTDIRDNCSHSFILLEETDNYTLLENGTVVHVQGLNFSVVFYIFIYPVVCAYIVENEIALPPFLRGAYITTLLITSLSIISSVALLVTYSLFKTLRTLPGQVIMNLAAAFLVGDVCVIIRVSLESNEAWFFILESHLFVTRFAWMALAGFEISRNIYNGIRLRLKSKRRRILIAYLICGWGAPFIPTIILATVHYTEVEDEERPLFGIGGYVISLVPIGLLLIFDIGVVVFLIIVLHRASAQKSKFRVVRRNTINFARVFLIILTVLGLSWFSIFIVVIRGATEEAVIIVYVLLTGSQPIFVSVAFIGTKKILAKYLILCGCKQKEAQTLSSPASRRSWRASRILSVLFSDRSFDDISFRSSFRISQRDSGKYPGRSSIRRSVSGSEQTANGIQGTACSDSAGVQDVGNKTMLEIVILRETSV